MSWHRAGFRALSLAGLSAAGLVGGHAVGYLLIAPDPHHRAALLAGTGHGYMPSLSWVLVACGVAALVAGVASGYLRGRPFHGSGRTMRKLLPVQAAAFLLIEVLERLHSGASLRTLSVSLLVVGVFIQLLVGVLVVLLVAALEKIGRTLRPPARIALPREIARRLPSPYERPRRSAALRANGARAPPAIAA
jgi:hypothetical protein